MIAYYDGDGKYLWVGTETLLVPGAPEAPKHPLEGIAAGKYSGPVDPDTQYHDLARGEPKDFPPKPGEGYVFNYPTKQWQQDTVLAWRAVRERRAMLLRDSDWRVTKAAEVGEVLSSEWQAYRQALRDITDSGDPYSVVWPTVPV